MHYKVYWVIDIDAEDSEHAAFKAQQIQRDLQSEATYFHVKNLDTGNQHTIDLPNPMDHSTSIEQWNGEL